MSVLYLYTCICTHIRVLYLYSISVLYQYQYISLLNLYHCAVPVSVCCTCINVLYLYPPRVSLYLYLYQCAVSTKVSGRWAVCTCIGVLYPLVSGRWAVCTCISVLYPLVRVSGRWVVPVSVCCIHWYLGGGLASASQVRMTRPRSCRSTRSPGLTLRISGPSETDGLLLKHKSTRSQSLKKVRSEGGQNLPTTA